MLAHLHDNRAEHIVDWKTNKLQNMSRNIYDLPPPPLSFFLFFFIRWKFKCSKYTQIIQVNRSDNILFISCYFICMITGLSISWTGKEMNRKTCLEIFMTFFFKYIFVCWKFKCSKYTQIIQVNRCACHPATNSTMTKPQHTAPSLTFFDQSLSVASRELLRQRMGMWWSRLTISKKAHSSFTSTFRISAGLSGGWSSRLRFP